MEATIIKNVNEMTVAAEGADAKEAGVIVELAAHQLALVGGGTANVSFL